MMEEMQRVNLFKECMQKIDYVRTNVYVMLVFEGSGKSSFTGAVSLVYIKGLNLRAALLPHQPPGVNYPLHKPTGKSKHCAHTHTLS